jgi:tetratricopeptide (TPR) repeat protein
MQNAVSTAIQFFYLYFTLFCAAVYNKLLCIFNASSWPFLTVCTSALMIICGPGNTARAQQSCACAIAETLRPEIAEQFNHGNLDSAALLIARIGKHKSPICQILYHNGMSQVKMSSRQLKDARNHLDKEYAFLRKMDCPERLSKHYANFSAYYNFQNHLDSAVMVALKGVDASEEAGDTITQIRLYCNVGAFFDQMKQYDNTVKYEEKALKLARQHRDVHSKAMAYTQISGTYLTLYQKTKDQRFIDKALRTAREGVENAKKSGEFILELDGYNILSKANYLRGKNAQALAFADSILQKTPRNVDFFYRNLQEAFLRLGEIHLRNQNFDLAKVNADSSVYYGNLFNPTLQVEPLKILYQAHKNMGMYKEAMANLELYKHLEDSLFNLEKNEKIAALDRKYNQAKNEQTISDLQKEAEIDGLRTRVLIFIVGLIILTLLLVLLIFRQKQLRKNQQLLESELRLNRSRMNPHFFFNALTTLQGMAVRENDGKKIAINLFKFSSLMRKTLESTYADYVSLDKELEFIQQYIEIQLLKFPERFRFEVNLSEDVKSNEILVPSMCIQPFLENAIEHGFSDINYTGELRIEIAQQGAMLKIVVLDNGKGLGVQEKPRDHISRATQITSERLQLLNKKMRTRATFAVAENASGGVRVDILLPLLLE